MNIAKLRVENATIEIVKRSPLPAGIVGGEIDVIFGSTWNGLTKYAIFKCNDKEIIKSVDADTVTIPQEIIQKPNTRLWVGFYGTNYDSSTATPTIWADLGVIKDAAGDGNDEGEQTSSPSWPELDNIIKEHKSDKNNPHNVTAEQLGVYSNSVIDEKFAEKIDKNNIPLATPEDTQQVRRKEDGSLWTGVSGVSTVNGKNGDVTLTLADIPGDDTHRTVTDVNISDWDSKQPAGDYATRNELNAKSDKSYVDEKLSEKIDIANIQVATEFDTREVRRKEDGSLWTTPGSGEGTGGAVHSVNGQTGNVVLKLSDIQDDSNHRTVSDAEKNAWNAKQDAGDYATVTELNNGLAGKQDVGDYATNAALTEGLAGKQDVGDYATNAALIEGLAGKQDAGNYATVEQLNNKADKSDLDNKLDKTAIPLAGDEDSQQVKRHEDGTLWTIPAQGSESSSAVESVNGKTGKVVLSLADIPGDSEHRTVSEADITIWNNKQDAGNYATADQIAGKADVSDLDNLVDKSRIGNATDKDVKPVRIKPDGSLWTSPDASEAGVTSVNGKTGDVTITLADVGSDADHRTVTDADKIYWDGKQDAGDYVTMSSLETELQKKQDVGNYLTEEELQASLATKQDIGDYVTKDVLQSQMATKQDVGDYATKDKLDMKVSKTLIGAATEEDTQEVHLAPDGRLLTKPTGGSGGEGNVGNTLTVNTLSGATVNATDGTTTLTSISENGVASFSIPNQGSWEVTAEKDGELTPTYVVDIVDDYIVDVPFEARVYGAEWDGTANTKWARTDAASEFTDPNPAVNNGTGSSPFDTIMPWAGMTRVSDPVAGELVKIPKFYYKWTAVGNGLKLQISMSDPDGTYFVSPAHMDRGDGKGERDIVYVGRYHCNSSYSSVAGAVPITEITRPDARTRIHSLGNDIWQWDWAMHTTIWMLYLVEFADWNCQTTIGRGCGNSSGLEYMGKSDAMKYHTGTPHSNRATYGVGVQYRNIEGLWDNAQDFLDGCYYISSGLEIIYNPANFNESSGGVHHASIHTHGFPTKFGISISNVNNSQVIYPLQTSSNPLTTTYSCDRWYFYGEYKAINVGGSFSVSDFSGINCIGAFRSDETSRFVSTRLMKLPNA